MDSNHVNSDVFNHVSSSQRENADAILTSEKLSRSDDPVDEINNLIIMDSRYELNKVTKSDTQVDLNSNPDTVTYTRNGPDTVTHASNGILDEILLSCGTIGKLYALPPPINPIVLEPQTLMVPAEKQILWKRRW